MLRDDIQNGTDVLRSMVRRRSRNKGSLTRLSNDSGLPRRRLIAFANGASLSGPVLQKLNEILLRVARFDQINDTFRSKGPRGPRVPQW